MEQIDASAKAALKDGIAHEDGATLWWAEDGQTGKLFLEFNKTRIWNSPVKQGGVPNTQIQLVFSDIQGLVFGREDGSKLIADWPKQVHEDRLKVHVASGQIFLNDQKETQQQIERIKHQDLVRGNPADSAEVLNSKYVFSVEIDSAIIVIVANSLQVRNHEGELSLESIPEKVKKWWLYYREYWKKKATNEPGVYDPICEAMIPLGN